MSDWNKAVKQPVEVEYKGPFYVKPSELDSEDDYIETIEGEFEITHEYLKEHDGYVIIKGVDGEIYPCALDIFERTYKKLE